MRSRELRALYFGERPRSARAAQICPSCTGWPRSARSCRSAILTPVAGRFPSIWAHRWRPTASQVGAPGRPQQHSGYRCHEASWAPSGPFVTPVAGRFASIWAHRRRTVRSQGRAPGPRPRQSGHRCHGASSVPSPQGLGYPGPKRVSLATQGRSPC